MNPEEITLTNLSKSFEYTKIANKIDECSSVDDLRDMAKCFAKLYFKQQETLARI
tara:strand:- start:175 stop:339 length:165 start_codon:yes stop_codon:yes gene_type:complete